MVKDDYLELMSLGIEGFRIVDATSTGTRDHDDLVWIGYGGMDGRWMTPEQALSVSKGIEAVVAFHRARRPGE